MDASREGQPGDHAQEPLSLVALHAGALGDFMLTHQLLGSLRSRRPDLRIEVVARSPLARWTAGRGVIQMAHDYETFGITQLFLPPEHTRNARGDRAENTPPPTLSVVRRLGRYDRVLNFFGSEKSAPARILRQAGLNTIAIDPAPTAGTLQLRRHITEQWMNDLQEPAVRHLENSDLRITQAERGQAAARLASVMGTDRCPRVLVHPGSGSRTKCYPLDRFEYVVGELRAQGCAVLWMMGPTELDWHGPEWVERLCRTAPVVYEEDIGSAACLIAAADAYIGNDAGMTHVAAAVGVRTVVVFGPTDPAIWGPLGRQVAVLRGDATFSQPTPTQVVRAVLGDV